MNAPAHVARVLERLAGVRGNAPQWTAKCPAHEDRTASLSIGIRRDGRTLLRCHGGCQFLEILAALNLDTADLRPDAPTRPSPPSPSHGNTVPRPPCWPTLAEAVSACAAHLRRTPSAIHRYTDAAARVVGAVVRCDTPEGKAIRPIWRTARGWERTYPRIRPPYRLAEVKAEPGVVIVEGEKAADAAADLGFAATTSPGGAESGDLCGWWALEARAVVVIPDADESGERYAQTVADLQTAERVAIVRLPGLRPDSGEDVVEWIDDRHRGDRATARTELRTLIAEAMGSTP